MKRYEVTIRRKILEQGTIFVNADNREDAIDRAEDLAWNPVHWTQKANMPEDGIKVVSVEEEE